MFDDWLERLRLSREETLEVVSQVTQEELDFRPAADQWSIGEVLDHLALAEQRVTQEVALTIAQVEAGGSWTRHLTFDDLECAPAFLPARLLSLIERPLGWLNRTFVSNRFRDLITRRRLFRIRHPSSADPRYGLPAGSHQQQLRASLRQLEQLLDDHRHEDLSRLRIVHPILGSKSIIDLIRFSIAHETRHRNQIVRASQAFAAVDEQADDRRPAAVAEHV